MAVRGLCGVVLLVAALSLGAWAVRSRTPEGTATKPPLVQCRGLTIKAKRCRNVTRAVDGFCYLHHAQANRSQVPTGKGAR